MKLGKPFSILQIILCVIAMMAAPATARAQTPEEVLDQLYDTLDYCDQAVMSLEAQLALLEQSGGYVSAGLSDAYVDLAAAWSIYNELLNEYQQASQMVADAQAEVDQLLAEGTGGTDLVFAELRLMLAQSAQSELLQRLDQAMLALDNAANGVAYWSAESSAYNAQLQDLQSRLQQARDARDDVQRQINEWLEWMNQQNGGD